MKLFSEFTDCCKSLTGLSLDTPIGKAAAFFIDESIKIFLLLYVLIFVISLFRAQLSPEKAQKYLGGKSRFAGYFLAAIFGAATPFCACSSVPIFIAFLGARIPFGIAMAFLIASPLISEIATVMLFGMQNAGPEVAAIYVLLGLIISILGGFLCDIFNLNVCVNYKIFAEPSPFCGRKNTGLNALFSANRNALATIKNLSIYIFAGLLVGAAVHGYVPEDVFIKYLGKDNPIGVPTAVILGAPIYANHASVVPIISVFLGKGVPAGTALVALMSITTISIPELFMLSKVFNLKLMILFVGFLIFAFIASGYLINSIT